MDTEMELVTFTKLDENGKILSERHIKATDIQKCPMLILVAEHYNADGSCRCGSYICEADGCSNEKYDEDIYCLAHLEEFAG